MIMPRQNSQRPGPMGRLTVRPQPGDGLVPKTVEFVRGQLQAWRDDPHRPSVVSEKGLNSSLCDHLDTRSRTLFPMVRFKHEAPQSAVHTVDIGVHGTDETTTIEADTYSIYEPFMVIEAKRLPAPTQDREREYVTGTAATGTAATGGIQRFKMGLHGRCVATAAIVGYIQRDTGSYWHRTINQWINDLVNNPPPDGSTWREGEALRLTEADDQRGIASAVSSHDRAPGCRTPVIEVYHLWVQMSQGSPAGVPPASGGKPLEQAPSPPTGKGEIGGRKGTTKPPAKKSPAKRAAPDKGRRRSGPGAGSGSSSPISG